MELLKITRRLILAIVLSPSMTFIAMAQPAPTNDQAETPIGTVYKLSDSRQRHVYDDAVQKVYESLRFHHHDDLIPRLKTYFEMPRREYGGDPMGFAVFKGTVKKDVDQGMLPGDQRDIKAMSALEVVTNMGHTYLANANKPVEGRESDRDGVRTPRK